METKVGSRKTSGIECPDGRGNRELDVFDGPGTN